jgi:recombination protein RecR
MYSQSLVKLIEELGRLPGIGPKSAQRIAFHVLNTADDEVGELAKALLDVKANIRFCEICGNLAEEAQCRICQNPHRTSETIAVVEEAKDIGSIERVGEYQGSYHVLGGVIDPIANVGPDDINIAALMARLGSETTKEVILATNPNVLGEATAAYLVRLIAPLGITVSRLASGLPVGGDLEYADEITLARAFSGRRVVG